MGRPAQLPVATNLRFPPHLRSVRARRTSGSPATRHRSGSSSSNWGASKEFASQTVSSDPLQTVALECQTGTATSLCSRPTVWLRQTEVDAVKCFGRQRQQAFNTWFMLVLIGDLSGTGCRLNLFRTIDCKVSARRPSTLGRSPSVTCDSYRDILMFVLCSCAFDSRICSIGG